MSNPFSSVSTRFVESAVSHIINNDKAFKVVPTLTLNRMGKCIACIFSHHYDVCITPSNYSQDEKLLLKHLCPHILWPFNLYNVLLYKESNAPGAYVISILKRFEVTLQRNNTYTLIG